MWFRFRKSKEFYGLIPGCVGAAFHRRPQGFIKGDAGRSRLFSKPSKSRDSAHAGACRGTPGEGSPRQNSPPDCFASPPALCKGRDFALCAGRPKVLPLETTAFEKAGEILLSGRQFAKNFLFRPTGPFFISCGQGQALPYGVRKTDRAGTKNMGGDYHRPYKLISVAFGLGK